MQQCLSIVCSSNCEFLCVAFKNKKMFDALSRLTTFVLRRTFNRGFGSLVIGWCLWPRDAHLA